MELTAISDNHGYLPKDLPGGDVLCICGDIMPLDRQSRPSLGTEWFQGEFMDWINSLPYRKALLIGGNHDFLLEDIGKAYGHDKVLDVLLPGYDKNESKLQYLCDSSIIIDGVLFYGTPWISVLSRWAFYKPHKELVEAYGMIPPKCDVLLTHMPPKGNRLGTVLQHGVYNTLADYGASELDDALSVREISYALCGHVHSGNHSPAPIGKTSHAVNVSLKDEDYKVAYRPFVFRI